MPKISGISVEFVMVSVLSRPSVSFGTFRLRNLVHLMQLLRQPPIPEQIAGRVLYSVVDDASGLFSPSPLKRQLVACFGIILGRVFSIRIGKK